MTAAPDSVLTLAPLTELCASPDPVRALATLAPSAANRLTRPRMTDALGAVPVIPPVSTPSSPVLRKAPSDELAAAPRAPSSPAPDTATVLLTPTPLTPAPLTLGPPPRVPSGTGDPVPAAPVLSPALEMRRAGPAPDLWQAPPPAPAAPSLAPSLALPLALTPAGRPAEDAPTPAPVVPDWPPAPQPSLRLSPGR